MQIDITKSNFKPFNILSLNYNYSKEEKSNLINKPNTPLHHLLIKTIKDYPEGGNTNTETIMKTNEFFNLNAYNEIKKDSSVDLIFNNHIDKVIKKTLIPNSLNHVLKQLYSTDIIFKEKFLSTRIYKPEYRLDYFENLYHDKLLVYRSEIVSIDKTQEELKQYNNVYNFLRKSILKISDISLLLSDVPRLLELSNESNINIRTSLKIDEISKYNNIKYFIKDSIKRILEEPNMMSNLEKIMNSRIKNILVEYFIENVLVSSSYKEKIKDIEYDVETVKKYLIKNGLIDIYKERLYNLYESGKIKLDFRQDEINSLKYNFSTYTKKYVLIDEDLNPIDDQEYFVKIRNHVLKLCFNHMFNVLFKNRTKKGMTGENLKDFFDRIKYDINSIQDKDLSLYDKLFFVFKEEIKNTYKDFFSLNIYEYVKNLVNVDLKNKRNNLYDTKFSDDFHLRLLQTGKYTLVDNTNFFLLLDDDNRNSYTRILTHFRQIETKRKMKYRKLLDFNYLYNKNDRFKNWVNNQAINNIKIFNSTIDLFSSSDKNTYYFISNKLFDNNKGLLKDISYDINSVFVPVDLYNIPNRSINIQNGSKNDKVKFYTLLWKLICNKFAILMLSVDSINNSLSMEDMVKTLLDLFEKLHLSSINKQRTSSIETYMNFIYQDISKIINIDKIKIKRYIENVLYDEEGKLNNSNLDLLLNIGK
jgi:hypothetical protein